MFLARALFLETIFFLLVRNRLFKKKTSQKNIPTPRLKKKKTTLKTFPSKKFKQSYEFIINLRDLDLKKPEEQVELWIALPHDKGKQTKIAALVGPELAETAKANFDLVILHDQFARYDKK